jgi:glutamate synthase (ferredoxin)
MVGTSALTEPEELGLVKGLVARHVELTGSTLGQRVLERWRELSGRFVKVLPHDYRRMLEAQQQLRAKGMSQDEAELAAFEMNAHDEARVGGN